MSEGTVPRRRGWRRFLQFSLKDLVYLVAIAAIGLGWWNAVRRPTLVAPPEPTPPMPTRFTQGGQVFGTVETGKTTSSMLREDVDEAEIRGDLLITKQGRAYQYRRWVDVIIEPNRVPARP